MLAPWKESCDKPGQHIKKQRHRFADKDLHRQSYGCSGSYMRMWELNHKECWVLKNRCFQIVVLESPLDCKEVKPVSPKGNQPWVFTERTDAEAEASILWPHDGKSWLISQTPLSRDSPGKNTGVDCHALLQGIFPTQGSNLCLLHWQSPALREHVVGE